MSQNALYHALLRPPVLHILRAAGFQSAKPAALDTLVDLAARYLVLLASKTAETSQVTHNGGPSDITDVRLALEEVGALRPGLSDIEGQLYGDDDTRGVDAFINWVTGDFNKEIRRIAGLVAVGDMAEVEGALEREDFLAALKKKHSKTGEESRFKGTMLGRDMEERTIQIDGGLESISAWEAQRHQEIRSRVASPDKLTPAMSAASTPLSDI